MNAKESKSDTPTISDMQLHAADAAGLMKALGNESRRELALIANAMQRMDDGTYGTCKECGEPIATERLKVQPYADECIECQEFDERRGTV